MKPASRDQWVTFYSDKLQSFRVLNEKQAQARCPFHEDHNPSFSIDLINGLWTCHAGCGSGNPVDFADKRSIARETIPGWETTPNAQRRIVDTYDYRDENGVLAYQVVRFAPKEFRQRRPGPSGNWIWNLNGVKRIPYRYPELLASKPTEPTIFIVEGEKDVENLRKLGFCATCNSGGAGKWVSEFSDALTGFPEVIIIPDKDTPGRKHANLIAHSLLGKISRLKILELPGDSVNDVSDWLNAGGNARQLMELVQAAHLWEPVAEIEAKSCDRALADKPEINAGDMELSRVTAEAWDALLAVNDPPMLFRSGGVAMRLELDDDRAPILRELAGDRLRHVLARAARWFRREKDGDVRPALPPMHVVRDMLAVPELPLPVLSRLVEAPVFAANGELQTQPGYHPASRCYFSSKDGMPLAEVPLHPTITEIANARNLLLEELLGDFPFTGDSERAHAVSCMLLPYARDLIDGATPLHLVEAPAPGTGKGLLVEVLMHPALGRSVTTMTEGRDEDEWRKRITSKLLTRPTVLLVDNLRRRLDSAAVAAAITSPSWEDRILGHSRVVALPVRCVWIATGNNTALSNEMARRCVRIRLDAKVDRPWLRNGFRHSLPVWGYHNRWKLLHSALVLIQAWIVEGRPQFSEKTLGTFDEWSRVMGGILTVAGIKGFLENLAEFYEASDEEAAIWRAFVSAWLDKFASESVGTSQLFELNESLEQPLDLGKGQEQSRRTKLGRALMQSRGRRFGDVRITEAGERQHAKRWRLIREDSSEPVSLGEPRPAPQKENIGSALATSSNAEAGNGSQGSPGSQIDLLNSR